MKKISYERYKEACGSYEGWCEDCKDFTRTGTEPDAEGYECPECSQNTVMGAENAMICMEFEVADVPDLSHDELMMDMMGN